MLECKVCHTEVTDEYRCPYCKYERIDLTLDADHSKNHRDKILSELKNISVDAENFKYSESNKTMVAVGIKKPIFKAGLNGIQCSRGVVQSEEWIPHFRYETEVIVNYLFNGEKRKVVSKIKPEKIEGIWYLGLFINKNLRLDIMLCVVPVNDTGSPQTILLDTVNLDLSNNSIES